MADYPTTAKRSLSDLRVHYISLVQAAANGRAFIAKQAKELGLDMIEKHIRIVKSDPVRKMVYGIVYAPDETDTEGDTMTAAEIEKSAYGFMQAQRTASVDTDHSFEAGAGFVAESWILREGDPLFPSEPAGAWAVGIKVTDDETWGRVEKSELTGLSLAGLAKAEFVAAAAEDDEDVAKSFVAKVRRLLVGDHTFWQQRGDGAVSPAAQPTPKVAAETAQLSTAAAEGTPPPAQAGSEPVEKSFKEKLLQGQLWRVADALSEALREVLQDDDVTDKVSAAREVCEEFVAWLEEQIGEAVAKAGTDGGDAGQPAGDGVARIEKQIGELLQVVKAAGEQQAALAGRVERIERQTPGRQTLLGGDDEQPVRKGKKNFKGLRFSL